MKELKKEEREFLEILTKLKPQKKPSGYYYFIKCRRSYKRSRVLIQLFLNKKLEMWEIVHRKDENKENDSIKNLEIIDTKNFDQHTSNHRSGKRSKKTTYGDFYKKKKKGGVGK